MKTHRLVRHPSSPSNGVTQLTARIVSLADGWLQLRWRIEGAGKLALPGLAGKGRADGLWRTTCFELFVRSGDGPNYSEFNFSPSERWAAYDFADYRELMAERPMPREPVCTLRAGGRTAIFDAEVPLAGLPSLPCRAALSAVIEEDGGVKSYWALAHPPGKPDFHDPACFAAMLAAPGCP